MNHVLCARPPSKGASYKGFLNPLDMFLSSRSFLLFAWGQLVSSKAYGEEAMVAVFDPVCFQSIRPMTSSSGQATKMKKMKVYLKVKQGSLQSGPTGEFQLTLVLRNQMEARILSVWLWTIMTSSGMTPAVTPKQWLCAYGIHECKLIGLHIRAILF